MINGYHNEENSKKRYPEKQRARRIVEQAVKWGHLLRKPCEVCSESKTQAHHDDYSKALEVRWLCPVHHTAVHRPQAA